MAVSSQPTIHAGNLRWRLPAIAAAVAVAAILIVLGVLLAKQFEETRAHHQRVDHSYQTRALIQDVLSLHQAMETGQRGFIVTGNADFLEPYREARGQIDAALGGLKKQTEGESESLGYFESIANLTREKIAFTDEVIQLQTQGKSEAATSLVAGGRGQILMDQLRGHLAQMDAIERRHLASAARDAEQSRRTTQNLTISLQALLALLLIGAAVVIAKSLKQKQAALERLEDLSRRQQAIFDAANDGMMINDAEGYIESLNPAAAHLYGYEEHELVGRHVRVLFANPPSHEDVQAILSHVESSPEGESRVLEFSAKRRDNSPITLDIALSPVPLADGMHYLAIIRDVTEKKRVEQMKTEFVSTVSHELRTPLTSIAGSLGLLTGGAAGALPERAAKLIKIAHANSERLVRLINDILDIEKMESGKMTFDIQPLVLRPLLEQAMQANQAYADEYGVELMLAPGFHDAAVMADADRLMQVMANLLSNAAKFSPHGGKVITSIAPLEGSYRITVQDQGSGIPPEFQARIFSKFAQADASDTRQKGGTGLGLSIVREIVAKLGGSVSFESRPGEGTAFHVDLPSVARGEADGVAPTPPADKSCILVWQEDEVTAARMKEILERAGYDADVARSAAAVRDLAQRRRYDAILLDLAFEGDESVNLIRHLRSDPRYASTPILVSATEEGGGDVSQTLAIADWIEKPVPVERLVEGVGAAAANLGGKPRILHVEDDPDVLRIVASVLEERAEVVSVMSVAAARSVLGRELFDLVVLDLGLPDIPGIELLPDLKNPDGKPIPVVIFSARDDMPELARRAEAMLTKSRASLNDLVETVEALIARNGGPSGGSRAAE